MNHNTLSNIAMFTVGAAIGSAVTWYLLKEKYERIAQEEIESVKETFFNNENIHDEPVESDEPIEEEEFTEADIREYKDAVEKLNYSNYASNQKPNKEVKENMRRPHVIEPGEFDTVDGYTIVSLTYYNDKILAYDDGEIVEDIDELIGIDPEDHFGEYEEDSVFVRDDERGVDYEILRDYSNYYEGR